MHLIINKNHWEQKFKASYENRILCFRTGVEIRHNVGWLLRDHNHFFIYSRAFYRTEFMQTGGEALDSEGTVRLLPARRER